MLFFISTQRGTVAIPFAIPARLSIFWKQNQNSLRVTSLKQLILFPKNHDTFNFNYESYFNKLNKQNFVKEKRTVWVFGGILNKIYLFIFKIT